MSEESLDFSDLKVIRIPVKVGALECTLVECSEDAAAQYENARTACARDLVDGKPTRLENTGALGIKLLSMCLLGADGKFISADVIKTWPHRVVAAIEARAKDISELNPTKKALQALKNESPATLGSSE